MKPPKCRLCGKEHWSHEPHVFQKEAGELVDKCVANTHPVANTVANKRYADWRKRNPELYRERQRELMRRRRAGHD